MRTQNQQLKPIIETLNLRNRELLISKMLTTEEIVMEIANQRILKY